MARLSHPNVVAVHDAGAIDERVFLAMEFVDGQTLAAWLAAAPRSWREIRDVFAAAGDGLAAAHDAGLVHRDFKPENVMVARDGSRARHGLRPRRDASADAGGGDRRRPRLAGGEAPTARTIALTATGTLLGTPRYMAPEQFLRARPTRAPTSSASASRCTRRCTASALSRRIHSLALAEAVTDRQAARARAEGARARVPAPPAAARAAARSGRALPVDAELLAELRFDPAPRRRVGDLGGGRGGGAGRRRRRRAKAGHTCPARLPGGER